MGRFPSEKPARLSEKLVYIRKTLDLSQGNMVRRLGLENKLTREDVSKYERGLRVPSLLTLLKYARAAGLSVDVLIDDELNLPTKLSSSPNRKSRKRPRATRVKQRR